MFSAAFVRSFRHGGSCITGRRLHIHFCPVLEAGKARSYNELACGQISGNNGIELILLSNRHIDLRDGLVIIDLI